MEHTHPIYIVNGKSYYENIIYDKLEKNQIREMCRGGGNTDWNTFYEDHCVEVKLV